MSQRRSQVARYLLSGSFANIHWIHIHYFVCYCILWNIQIICWMWKWSVILVCLAKNDVLYFLHAHLVFLIQFHYLRSILFIYVWHIVVDHCARDAVILVFNKRRSRYNARNMIAKWWMEFDHAIRRSSRDFSKWLTNPHSILLWVQFA